MPRQKYGSIPGASSFAGPLCILTVILAFMASSPLASASSPSPAAEQPSEMICSPDCYPKLFVPSHEFQAVREGQELPPGLHVRINVNTGEKEAKIHDPNQPDDPALEGLPVDSSVVVVEQQEGQGSDVEEEGLKVPAGAPRYEPVGKIKVPEAPQSGDDHSVFAAAMKVLSLDKVVTVATEPLLGHLESLEDLAHDIYFGLKVVEDEKALKALFCLMTSADTETERKAAAVVAAATQNNPTALAEVVKKWSLLSGLECPGSKSKSINLFYDSVVSPNPRTTKAKVAALNGLVKNKRIKHEFLTKGGMGKLLYVVTLDEGKREWEPVKTKVGHFVLDNFLDESMGAVLGVWPSKAKKDIWKTSPDCSKEDTRLADECWPFHLRVIAEAHEVGEGHWSQEIYEKLTGRNIGAPMSEHGEL